VFKAVATEGKGVLETFFGMLQLTWGHLQTQHQFEQRFGVEPRQLLLRLSSQLGLPKGLLRGLDEGPAGPPRPGGASS
jgi:hypothetical protein